MLTAEISHKTELHKFIIPDLLALPDATSAFGALAPLYNEAVLMNGL